MQNKQGSGTVEDPVLIGKDPYHESLFASHVCIFVCHSVAYCGDVYANEPS